MEGAKRTLNHQKRKKTAVTVSGGGGGTIGAVLLLGGALATAAFVSAFVRKRSWSSGEDRCRRRRRQDQKSGEQDGPGGATEDSNVPKEIGSVATKENESNNFPVVTESIKLDANPRAEIDGGIPAGCGCDIHPSALGNDEVSDGSVAINEDEILPLEPENMMNGGDVKIPFIKEDHVVSGETEMKASNFDPVYAGDAAMKCEDVVEELQIDNRVPTAPTEAGECEEKGLGVFYVDGDNKCEKIEDHVAATDEDGSCGNGEADGVDVSQLQSAVSSKDVHDEIIVEGTQGVEEEEELVKEQERFGPAGDAVGPKEGGKDELISAAEEKIPCEEDTTVGTAAESLVVDDDEPCLVVDDDERLMKLGLYLPTENEGDLKRSLSDKEVEEELMLPVNVEDEAEEEEAAEIVEVKENNVVGRPKQHEDNVERDTADEVEKIDYRIANNVATVMSGNTDVIEESSVETGDSSMDSKSDTILPSELPCQEKIVIGEVEGKSLEDAAVKEVVFESNQARTKEHNHSQGFHTIPYSSQFSDSKGIPEKSLIKKYTLELARLKGHTMNPTRRSMVVGTVSVVSSLSCSWFFGLSFIKLCAIVVLTMAMSRIHSY